MSSEAIIEDLTLDEAVDLETAAGEAIYTSELRGSDEAGLPLNVTYESWVNFPVWWQIDSYKVSIDGW